MKKLLILLLCFVFCFSACGTEEPQTNVEPPETSSENASEEQEQQHEEETPFEYKLFPVKTWTNSIGTSWAQVVIGITNVSSENLYLDSASVDLETEDGSLFATQSYINAYPQVIAPSETAYYYEEIMLDSAPEGQLYDNWHISVAPATVEQIQFPVTDVTVTADSFGYLKAIGRVENTTSEEQSLILVSIMLFDAENVPIGHMFNYVDLAPNDKMGFECSSLSLPDDITIEDIASYVAVAYPHQYQF